jgi:hypothetical protein
MAPQAAAALLRRRAAIAWAVRGRGLVGALAWLGYHHAVGIFPFREVGGRREEVREDPGESVRETGVEAAYGLVTYLIRADC